MKVKRCIEFLQMPLPRRDFDISATNVCKCVAICLMLLHHCLPLYKPQLGAFGRPLWIGGKVCVAMFCFLSGVGLVRASFNRAWFPSWVFRLMKLLINFWIVAAIWILCSCYLEDRGFADVYPKGWNPAFINDMFGLQISIKGFNGSWWFMGLIIPLYAISPLLLLLRKISWPLLIALALGEVMLRPQTFGMYSLPFVYGMIIGGGKTLEKFCESCNYVTALGMIGLFYMLFWWRGITIPPPLLEGVLAMGLIMTVYIIDAAFISRCRSLESLFCFIGKHSMNVFLIHGYFLINYPSQLTKMPPWVTFVAVLCASLAISVAIEWLKKLVGLHWAFNAYKRRWL